MNSVPVQPQLSAEFLSGRGVIANSANSAHADHFSRLLAGIKTLSAHEVQGSSVTKTPGHREELGSEIFKDVHGLDKIMEGMEVASKLNTHAIHASKDEMSVLCETMLRLQADGDTYFMQTNFVNQRLSEMDEHIKAVTRSRS